MATANANSKSASTSPLGLILAAPFTVILLLAFVLMPIWLPIYYVIGKASFALREKRFRRRMENAGRFIPWNDLLPRLQRGEGTLIVESAQKDATRVWWTEEDVRRAAGALQPAESIIDYYDHREGAAFVAWCHAHYIDVKSGAAMLTQAPYRYPPGFPEASFFHERFPSLAVVMTLKVCRGWFNSPTRLRRLLASPGYFG